MVHSPGRGAWLQANQIEHVRGLSGFSVLSQSDFRLLGDALEHIRREFFLGPYAFSPIRTSPKRTYDPISAEPSPEGSHVPMLLAALSRSAQQQQWAALQLALKEFGSKIGRASCRER